MRKRVYFGYWFQWMPVHSGREDMALGGGGRWSHHRQQERVRMDLEVRITFYYLNQYPEVSTSSQKSITTSGQNIHSQELGASVRCKPKQTLSRANCQHFKILPSQLSLPSFTLQLEHIILYLVCLSLPVKLREQLPSSQSLWTNCTFCFYFRAISYNMH